MPATPGNSINPPSPSLSRCPSPSNPFLSTLLLLNLPPQSFVGIDLLSFTSTSRFSGIKYIPHGFHHVYYSPGASPAGASSAEKDAAPDVPLSETNAFNLRSGFWFEAKGSPDDIIIKEWDSLKEDFVDETELPTEQVFKIKANLGQVYNNNLTPYRQLAGNTGRWGSSSGANLTSESRLWKDLVSSISPALLDRILVGSNTSLLHLPGASKWKITTTSSSPIDYEDVFTIPPPSVTNKPSDEGNEAPTAMKLDNVPSSCYSSSSLISTAINNNLESLTLLPIDLKRTFPPNSIGRERTLAAKDRSWYLTYILSSHYPLSSQEKRENNLLGELQFTYITSLTLANYSCIEQWRRILGVVLTCQESVPRKIDFFKAILEILITQFRALDVLGGSSPGFSSCSAGGRAGGGEGGGAKVGGGGGGGGEGIDQEYQGFEDHSTNNFWSDFLEGTPGQSPSSSPISVQKLLRTFLRTLRLLKADDPSNSESTDVLMNAFNNLEDLAQSKFDWTLDTRKIVKRGTIQLEDGEIVEMDLDELGEEEDEEGEKGEWAPVVVEL